MSSDQYEVIDSILSSNDCCYLATIVHVEGSSYRKKGAMMFISEHGIESGLLSGGCIEQDLLARIEQLESPKAFFMIYDLRSEDDLSWGQGVGCDGSISIFVEPINKKLRNQYVKVKHQLEQRSSVQHVIQFNQLSAKVESFFYSDKGEIIGQSFYEDVIFDAQLIPSSWKGKYIYEYKKSFNPPPRLIIYGAGPDVKPIVLSATKVGFYVVLADWRPLLCTKENIPYAKEYIVGHPIQAMEKIKLTSQDYCLVMTHSYLKDQELVDYLLNKQLTYLGILGSKKRTIRLLQDRMVPDWVKFPVGMPIFSESPEEIAISIVAELIQLKNCKKKVSL